MYSRNRKLVQIGGGRLIVVEFQTVHALLELDLDGLFGNCLLYTSSGIWLASEEALLNEFVQQIAAGFEEKGLFDEGGISFFTLLLNNLYAAGISILIGCIPFFFLTILPLFSNAVVLGAMGALYQTTGIGMGAFLIGILPHGILELPALLVSFALGLYLCWTLSYKICLQRERSFRLALKEVGRAYLLIVVPLLLAAAVTETYVTPVLMGLCLSLIHI